MADQQGVVATLTDGTGISKLTSSKLVKDLVLDFLMTAGAALATVNIVSVDAAAAQPWVVGTALGGALIRVAVRAIMRWAQS